jgi:hypothetical protein
MITEMGIPAVPTVCRRTKLAHPFRVLNVPDLELESAALAKQKRLITLQPIPPFVVVARIILNAKVNLLNQKESKL